MAFLFEPYNAYQKPPKKKHWMEIAEEEALLHRINLEEQVREESRQQDLFQEALKQHLALREANAKQNPSSLNNQNVALPQYAPQPASQQVQDGQFAAPAGGGGWVLPQLLESQEESTEIVSFTAVPSSGPAPLQVVFTNTTPTPGNDTFLWQFGSGSLTSTLASPGSRTYTSTGSYTVNLQGTSSAGNMTTAAAVITVVVPTLNAWVSLADVNTVAPYSASITGSHTYNGAGTVSGLWNFGDGAAVAAYVSGAGVKHIYTTGSWTASLALTESYYGIKNVATIYISASKPWVSPLFTATPVTGIAPYTTSFDNTSTYALNSTFVYVWIFGDGKANSSLFEPTHGYQTGSFPVQLHISESYYGIAGAYLLPGGITGSVPTVSPSFTVDVPTGTAPLPVTTSNTSTIQIGGGGDYVTYRYDFGDGSPLYPNGVAKHEYGVGEWAIELQVTESLYNIRASYLLPGGVTGSL